MGVGVGVEVAVERRTTGDGCGVSVTVGVGVSVGVEVVVGVSVGLGVQEGTRVLVGLGVDVGIGVEVKVGSGVRVGGTCASAWTSMGDGDSAVVPTSHPRQVIAAAFATTNRIMTNFQSLAETSWNHVFKRSSILSHLSLLDILI